jgi:hypothetical protein
MKKHSWPIACVLGIGMALSLPASAADGKDGKGGEGKGRPGGDPEARFKAMDTDGNGAISIEEYKASQEKRVASMKEKMGDKFDAAKVPNPEEAFKKADANGDGQLSKEEVQSMRKAMGPGGRREGGKGHGPDAAAPKPDAEAK